jgi:hypothetical protein
MNRYHKKIYFPADHKEKLISFTYIINRQDWQYTKHCIDNIKLRELDMRQLLYWIKSEVYLDYDYIFEYYTDDNGEIEKVCYRISYNKGVDIILVIGINKKLITIYYNAADDKHYTLRKENYIKI